MASSPARKYRVTPQRRATSRAASRPRGLRLESLESRNMLATGVTDQYETTEDVTFGTGIQTVFESTPVIPRAVAGSLGAPGWRSFDDLAAGSPAYPTAQNDVNTPWYSFFFDPDAAQTYGSWDAPRQAPFEFGDVTGISAFSPIDAPAATETGALFRKFFTLTAAQAASTVARFNLLCDDGCVVYINDVEVLRQGLVPPGPRLVPDYTNDTDQSETMYFTNTVDLVALGVPLVEGENLIAMENVNRAAASTDLGFDLEMFLGTQVGSAVGVQDNDTCLVAPCTTVLSPPGVINPQINGRIYALDTATLALAGFVAMEADGDFTFTPTRNYTEGGVEGALFQYDITDSGGGGLSTTDVYVHVNPVNDAPVATNDAYTSTQGSTINVTTVGAPLVEAGNHLWHYHSTGLAPPPNWNLGPTEAFDPATAGWSGPALGEFGYSHSGDFENDEATPIPCDATPADTTCNTANFATAQFFTTFDVPGTIPTVLTLDIKRDDEAVVWINGVEVFKDVGLTSTAFDFFSGGTPDENNFQRFTLDLATLGVVLAPTGNHLAVQVHQDSATSSDVSFNLQLSVAGHGLLANDRDVDDAPSALSVHLPSVVTTDIDPATEGTVVVDEDGTFTFTPVNAGVSGTFTFTYQTKDDEGTLSGIATVTIVLSVDPNQPVSNPDSYTVLQGGTLVTEATSVTYLARGSAGWSYFDEMTNGQDPDAAMPLPASPTEQYPLDAQGDAWYENDFDTATSNAGIGTWKTGAGPLGAGGLDGGTEPDIVLGTTVQGNDVATGTAPANVNNTVTTYLFRRMVNIPDGASRDQLSVELLADDGGILRVNGTVVLRDTMPADPIDSTTLATGALSEAYKPFNIDVTDLLVNGDNLFTFELHQNSVTSSDVGFDLAVKNALGVLANDSDPQADPLTAVLGTGPANAASFALSPNGTFTYTPNAAFSGTDTFTYRASDGVLQSPETTVTITVTSTSTCANNADLNGDTVVNRGDLAVLIQSYGMTAGATPAQGDINCDGAIGLLDLIELQDQLTPAPSPGAASAVVARTANSTPAVDRAVTGLDRAIERVRPRAPLAASRLEQVRERVQENTTGPARPSQESAETTRASGIRASRVARAARAHNQAIQDLFG